MEDTGKDIIKSERNESGNLTFRDLFYKYVRFLPVFIISVALALLAAFLYLRYAVPVYSATGSMLIKSGQPTRSSDKLEQLFDVNPVQNIQSEIEILKSKPLMKRVVDSLGLQYTYYAKGKIKTVNVYKQAPFRVVALSIVDSGRSISINIKGIDSNRVRVNDAFETGFNKPFNLKEGSFMLVKKSPITPSSEFNVTWRRGISRAAEYAGALSIMPKVVGTGILNVKILSSNSQMGADIVNTLMQQYSQYNVEQKQLSSDQVLNFIDGRLAESGLKLDSVQRMYLDYQVRNNLIDEQMQSAGYFENITLADKATSEEMIKGNVAGMIDTYLADKQNNFSKVVVPSTLNLQDPTLNALVSAYNAKQIERQQLLDANIPLNNPVVVEAANEIEKLRTSIRENLRNIRQASGNVVATYRQRTGVSEQQLRAMPVKVKELTEIRREVEAVQNLYRFLQEKKEETSLTRASTISGSEVIDMAMPSDVPVKPNRRTIQIIAVLVGLGLPALFIFIAEVLNDKVSTRFDIERITNAPILGEIGHSYSENTLVVSKTTRSMVAEQFRIIRSNLQYVLNKKEKATILVSSSFSGEGKSYVSTNMGAVLALAGKKTVILEFDIRKPKILSGLKIQRGQGITNYLVGNETLNSLIKPVPEYENLFVLGCGPIPPNPAELLLDTKLDEMFAWLKNNFDIILVDTAPVGMVSDAMSLSKFADCTLYLVRQGHTFKKQVTLIDEFYKSNKLPKLSIIVNDVKLKAGYGYYGYGRYGYGYGYGGKNGSYYEEETPPSGFWGKLMNQLGYLNPFNRKSR